jgi:hypothetical protein
MSLYWPHQIQGSQSVTLGANVFAFISNLGPNNTKQMLKVGPKFFWP